MQEPEGLGQGTHKARGPKGQRTSRAAASSKASRGSGALDSDAQLSSKEEDLTQANHGPDASQLEGHTDIGLEDQDIQLTQPQIDPGAVKECMVDSEQRSSMSLQHQKCMAVASGFEGWQQRPPAEGVKVPGPLPTQRKEPLCLRVRPLDSPTRRLMQSLGCTALLEMPNNK